jgi:unsaturated chondroitin disaccharide hydrolase
VESSHTLAVANLLPAVHYALELASEKTMRLERRWKVSDGAPVFTIGGRYTARDWTQWTQGFQYGNALLCFELTGNQDLLSSARGHIVDDMAEHLTHTGVHDHGFNNISTYGHMRRLALEGRIEASAWELRFYELALKVSGAVQATRWTSLNDGLGFVHSFNGSHSLFIDTIRTLRICCLSHTLGHSLLGEQDKRINLLGRVLTHAKTSALYNIYYGEGRDGYDVPELCGRTVHEAVFNPASGVFRCPSSQQGYSPFSTWTRGLAWGMLGFAETLEFVRSLPESEFGSQGVPAKAEASALLERAARATCDFYIHQASAADGICYWDTGAPQLYRLGDWQAKPADPYNDYEAVDSSASAIAAQGLIRLGHILGAAGNVYTQAGLTVAARLLEEPYLARQADHEGLLLHSIYHRPNGWDFVPASSKIPWGESSMWGDYHLLELSLLITRMAESSYYTFFGAETKG